MDAADPKILSMHHYNQYFDCN